MIVLDGRLHEGPTAPFDLSDRGLLLADGLFETMLVVDGRIFRRDAHLDRLAAGAVALSLPIERARLDTDLDLLLGTIGRGDHVLRLTVTRGGGSRGLGLPAEPRPTVLVTAAPWSPALVGRPIRLATAAIRRNASSPAARFKTLAYLDAVVALAEAQRQGADDALFLDPAGRVTSTTMANLFALLDGRLATPRLDDGVLDGTTRRVVLEVAQSLGIATEERSIEAADLPRAEAIFATNSVRLVSPVVALDGAAVSQASDLVTALLDGLGARIAAECGRDPRA